MNRDKLIEAIRLSIARVLDFKVNEKELELLSDHLIANGIGDITAEKHRADVAEEALRLVCGDLSSYYYMTGAEALAEIYIHQATERLKEKQ